MLHLRPLFKSIPIVNHSLSYNPSIDGLRGIAVSLVLIFHIWHETFSFGYVGVDIFFVLSGFLITQIIYQKISRHSFCLKEFYRNRIRRIFPAVLVTLLAVFIVGYLFMFNDELSNLGKHIKSSALFYENFRLIGEVGYWDKDASLKPLLHFWSLAIEEQFYIFWPFILIGLFYLRSKFNVKISLSLSVVCAILFILPCLLDINRFYHLISRAYELAFGGAAFVLAKEYKRIVAYLHIYKKAIYAFFIIAIAASFANTQYSWFKTLLITLASAALIISLTREKQSAFFASTPLVFLGLISFPLYLNHYAIISFCHILGIDISGTRGIIVLIACIVLAFLVYRFVEIYARAKKSYLFAGVLLVIMISAGFGGVAVHKNKIHRGFINTLEYQEFENRTNYEQSAKAIVKSLGLRDATFSVANTSDLNASFNLIFGDSHASFAMFNIAKADSKNKTLMLGYQACPGLIKDYNLFKTCEYVTPAQLWMLENLNIKRLFLIAFLNDERFKGKEELFYNEMDRLFRDLSKLKFPVYVLIDNPTLPFEPSSCIERLFGLFERRDKCKVPRSNYDKSAQKYKSIVQEMARKYPRINLIDPTNGFCDKHYCYAFKGKTALYVDKNHLSVAGEEILFNEIKKHIDFNK